jgi:hypothetical protein
MTNHCKSVRETYVVHKGFKVYNFQKCLEYLENEGKTTYSSSFKISEMDHPTIYKLLIYMIKDEKAAMNQNIDLSKGILVSGSIGCGKTSLMNLVRPFAYHPFEYKIKTCREVSFEFAKNGFEAINCYTLKQANQSKLTGYCFDDLGAEQQIKHFGNDCNVMAEVLISRYEQFVENKSVTHITTNLSASEIENNYGNRLRSRMRQMFNLITFDSRTKDKR